MTKKDNIIPLPPTLEELAKSIRELARVGRAVKQSQIKESGILVLLNHVTRLPQRDIKKVLDALPNLEREFLKGIPQ